MATIRTFIAVNLSSEVGSRAEELMSRLRVCGVKATWTKPANLHLTLKFLGEVPDPRVPDVCRAVEQGCSGAGPMKLTFRGAGAFPRAERPRTVWIGVQTESSEFADLQQSIEECLYDRGFARERRRFVPHLTIGRVRAGGPEQLELGRLILEQVDFDCGSCTIDQVVTYGSFLDKSGPTYQVLGRSGLGG